MKRKSLFLLCLFFVSVLTGSVYANGPYAGIEAGLALPSSSSFVHSISTVVVITGAAEINNGYAVGGVAGYRFSKWRLEGELVYRENDFDKIVLSAPLPIIDTANGQVSVTTFFLNTYYDIELSDKVVPYVGIGAGYSWLSVDLSEDILGLKLIDNETDSCPAVQFIAGAGIPVTPQITIDAGYRYILTGPVAIEGLTSADFTVSNYGTHNFLIGARYNF